MTANLDGQLGIQLRALGWLTNASGHPIASISGRGRSSSDFRRRYVTWERAVSVTALSSQCTWTRPEGLTRTSPRRSGEGIVLQRVERP